MSNIVLTGFMGTGKTTVGRRVAARLGRPFVDMDAEIEARSGKSIPQIFAEDGEAAFRAWERQLCWELSAREGLVIATGGGALLEAASRTEMMRSGTVICLTCTPDEILRRLSGSQREGRPLLAGGEPRERLAALLNSRRRAYGAIPWQIDTTNLASCEVAEQVVELAGAIVLPVCHPSGEYSVNIGGSVLKHIGGLLRAAGAPEQSLVAVVANPVVDGLYGQAVRDSLSRSGLRPVTCPIPDGEQYKTLATVSALYDAFAVEELDRSGTVVALGGGVTTDLAGFAAATYMRGVRLAHVPTTLLAMVDACTGGKVGVDLECGKNLVGAFKQPALALVDLCVLSTLPMPDFRSGMAELIKQALIGDPELFGELEAHDGLAGAPRSQLKVDWLARSLRVKARIVEEDPFDEGRRAVLNLGHTVGHALEVLSGFRLRHGEAVSVGIVAAARIGVELGIAHTGLLARIEGALSAWGLPVRCPAYRFAAIWQAMKHDKKRRAQKLCWVLPKAVGDVEVVDDVAPGSVRAALGWMGARG